MSTPTLEKLSFETESFARKMKIPPCPEIAAKVMAESRAEEPDFKKIGALISKDLSLAATVLRTVNSPFYGLRSPVDSIQQALMMLGLQTVSSLVVGLLLKKAFPNMNSNGMRRFWDVSSRQAALGTFVATSTGTVAREVAYTFGLFRQCGMPILRTQHVDYEPFLDGSAEERGRPLLEVESNRFGVTHAQLGFLLARGWYMPVDTCQAILHGSAYPVSDENRGEAVPSSLNMSALGIVTDWIGDQLDRSSREIDASDWTFALGQLGLSEDKARELVEAAPGALESNS